MQKICAATLFLWILSGSLLIAQSISRVEPSHWWTGMRYNEIELLVYGKEIGHLNVQVHYPGVSLRLVKQVSNPNYLFITLHIAPVAQAGTMAIDFLDKNRKILSHPFEIKAREPGRATVSGFDSHDVIYMLTPDRFANGDPSNDNLPGMLETAHRNEKGGRHGGDIKGISDHLDYIRDLGFTALWINPLLENNMKAYSYHGYAITDLYKTDPRFGTNEDYQRMVAKARSLGIKVIMDMVANHIGIEHWWMKDLPMADWINQWETFTYSNHKKTVILDPYASAYDKKAFFDGWFDTHMPDINQRNPLLARYLIQNTIWWIEYAGLSGIRMDTYPYPDMEFMAEWSKAVMEEYPDFNIVGEEWSLMQTVCAYWQRGKQNPNGYVSHLKSVMDFPLNNALIESLNQPSDWSSSWNLVYQSMSQDYLYPDPQNILVFPDNHDMSRIFTLLKEDLAAWKLAMTCILTMRGIPCIYYGTEILKTSPEHRDDGLIRSDFPGGWDGDAVNAFTGKGLNNQQREALNFIKQLLTWRLATDAVHHGKLMHFAPDVNDVYVYFRYLDHEKVMILLNKNQSKVTLPLMKYREILGSASRGWDVFSGKEVSLVNTLDVPARSPMIIKVDLGPK